MKVNYEKLKELNIHSMITPTGVITVQGNGNEVRNNGGEIQQLSCFYVIQNGIERYLNGETVSEEYKKFLIDVGVLEEETNSERNIVQPFNFMGNDRPQGN